MPRPARGSTTSSDAPASDPPPPPPSSASPPVRASTTPKVADRERRGVLADFAGPGLSAEWTAEVERRVLAAVADSGEVTGVRLGTLVPELREEIPYRVGPSYGTQQTVGARLVRALGPAPVGRRRRDRYRAEEPRAELFDRSGNIGPTVGWDGRVVGDWARRADASPVREFPAPVPPAGGVGARTGPAGAGAVRAPGWGQRRKKGRA